MMASGFHVNAEGCCVRVGQYWALRWVNLYTTMHVVSIFSVEDQTRRCGLCDNAHKVALSLVFREANHLLLCAISNRGALIILFGECDLQRSRLQLPRKLLFNFFERDVNLGIHVKP